MINFVVSLHLCHIGTLIRISDEELKLIGMHLQRSPYWSELKRVDVLCCRALTQEFLFWFEYELEGKLSYVMRNLR